MLQRILQRRNDRKLDRFLAEVRSYASKLNVTAAEGLAARMAWAVTLAKQTLGVSVYSAQIRAAYALADGNMLEFPTGEGKTLVAALAIVAAKTDKPVHVVTANPYLAMRDAHAMAPLYAAAGLTVSYLSQDDDTDRRYGVYAADVVYGTATLFAQDYLRDGLILVPEARRMPSLGWAIIDEADAVLLDEATAPVVIAQPVALPAGSYQAFHTIAQALEPVEHFVVEDRLAVSLTDKGYERVFTELTSHSLMAEDSMRYEAESMQLIWRVVQALTAQHLLRKDEHYVLQAGRLVLVDAVTGRLLPGRTWDSGLQQALEVKEGLGLSLEMEVLASTTLPHFFQKYARLSGMTGTAKQAAVEFSEVYGLDTVVVAPEMPSLRQGLPYQVFRSQAQKLEHLVAEVARRHATGQPVLIGTRSVAQSELVAAALEAKGIPVAVLNAKTLADEAAILANAGRLGQVTVATQLAGRGVDIRLGGDRNGFLAAAVRGAGNSPQALAAAQAEFSRLADAVRTSGGLHIIGFEHFDCVRHDRQFMGRTGRQGEPGSFEFYVSLEDELVEGFAGEQLRAKMAQMDLRPGTPLGNALILKAVQAAQRQKEGWSAAVRKDLRQKSDVLAAHDQVFRLAMQEVTDAPWRRTHRHLLTLAAQHLSRYVSDDMVEAWDMVSLNAELADLQVAPLQLTQLDDQAVAVRADQIFQHLRLAWVLALRELKPTVRRAFAFAQLLYPIHVVRHQHLQQMELLRQGIHLRAHAKIDPRYALMKDSYELLEQSLAMLRRSQTRNILSKDYSAP